MSVALHGNLRDFGIADVFQLIGQQHKTGTLVVDGDEGSIFLAFDQGCVVRGGPAGPRKERDPLGPQLVRAGFLTREQLDDLQAESERSARPLTDLLIGAGLVGPGTLEEVQHLLTKETVFDVIRRQNGDFDFIAEAVVHETKPENLLGAEQILMDGLRMLDEWQVFSALVPSGDTVFRRAGNLAAAQAVTKGDSDSRLGRAERVLQLVDGRLSVRRVIDLSRVGTFEATRALAELRQAGVIDVETAAPRKARRPKRSGARIPVLSLLRAALATALPFVLLGALGFQVMQRTDSTGGLPGASIPPRLSDQFGARHESELIRRQLEVHHFAHGQYPERLDALASGLPSLTQARLAAYYYAVRDDEVVLLAPTD